MLMATFLALSSVAPLHLTSLKVGAMATHTGSRDSLIQVSACYVLKGSKDQHSSL